MWSPPRARSTMMMRVFEALGCAVFDEPFYAYWLKATNKKDDPGFAKTIAAHETDWRRVVDQVLGPIPEQRDWYYQKHMAIHMLDEVDLSWMQSVRNCFLIRDPAEVVLSMSEFRTLAHTDQASLEDAARLVGIPQLRRIFDRALTLDEQPVVLDVNDVLKEPGSVLARFCAEVGLPFDPRKPIKWAPGKHSYDGAWADDWYQKVFDTTHLTPYREKTLEIPDYLQQVVDYCRPHYEFFTEYKL